MRLYLPEPNLLYDIGMLALLTPTTPLPQPLPSITITIRQATSLLLLQPLTVTMTIKACHIMTKGNLNAMTMVSIVFTSQQWKRLFEKDCQLDEMHLIV